MPQILGCFSTFSNNTENEFIQWHEPLLADSRLAIVDLDSVFHILWSRPNLRQIESKPPRSVRHPRRSGGADAGANQPREYSRTGYMQEK